MRQIRERIYMEEYRTLGATFNHSLAFIRGNFSELSKAFLFLAGPVILVYAMVEVWFADRSAELSIRLAEYASGIAYNLTEIIVGQMGILSLQTALVMVVQMLLVVLAARFVLDYDQSNGNHSTFKQVLPKIKPHIRSLLGLFALLFALSMLINGFFYLMIYSGAYLGTGFHNFALFLVAVATLFIYFPLFFIYGAGYVAVLKEGAGAWAAFKRGFSVVNNQWWWTWWIMILAILIFWLLGQVFHSPEYVIQLFIIELDLFGLGVPEAYNNIMLVAGFIGSFFSQLIDGFLYILVVFHFYSLVERKEATGLMKRINSIGSMPEFNRGEEDY